MAEKIVILPAGKEHRSFKGSFKLLVKPSHVHNDRGECIKNRYGRGYCDA